MSYELQLKGVYRPTILVVDDSETVRKLVCRLLSDEGYRVEGVGTGREALEWLQFVTPTLLLLDYRLPDINGKEVVEALQAVGRDVPFIIITGHGDESIAVEMMKLGAADYLVKDEAFLDLLPAVLQQTLQRLRSETLLQETEEALVAKEARFAELFSRMQSGVAIFEAIDHGEDFVFLDLNPAVERIEGVNRNDVVGRRLLEVFPGAEEMGFLKALRQVWITGQAQSLPATYYKDRRRQGWRENQIYRLPSGEVVSVYDDVSERRHLEGLLFTLAKGDSASTGEAFFYSLVHQLSHALEASFAWVAEILPHDPSRLRVVAASESGQGLAGFEFPVEGTPCQQVLSDGSLIVASGIKERFPNTADFSGHSAVGFAGVLLTGADGQKRGVLAVLCDEPLADPQLAGTLLQIFASRAAAELERQYNERVLRESERRYRKLYQEFETILDGIPDQISLLTPGLEVIWSNRNSQTLARQIDSRQLKQHCYEFLQENPTACESCHAQQCVETGQMQEAVVRKGEKVFGVKFFPLKDERGAVHSVISLASDITEKMRLRDEADRASRLASLGEIAAGVAHEINNPNALILLNASVLGDVLSAVAPLLERRFEQEGDFSVGRLSYSRMRQEIPRLHLEIADAAQRIRRIVEELREFVGRSDSVERQVVGLNQVAAKSVRLVSQTHPGKSIELVLGQDATVCGDAQQLEQVVINLLLNALQALPSAGGEVHIHTCCDSEARLGIIHVRDEGMGIPPEHLAKITDPFFTTKRERGGTGLGLAVAARIVRQHGGTLEYSSTPGKGTDVWLRLPFATSKEAAE